MNSISIIIPVLNEEKNIRKLLLYLRANVSGIHPVETIVVDGGSKDATKKIVSTFEEIVLLDSLKGRAVQMNYGAKRATGSVLYFLHADSFPPENFDTLILEKIKDEYKAGCFRMQFEHKHWLLRLSGWLTRFSWKACRGGDQSLFVTKKFFQELGGFNEDYVIYEDNDFINRIYKSHRFAVIQEKLKTSARLYERNGVYRLQYHFMIIHVKKWLGASPKNLHTYYQRKIRKLSS